MYSTSGCPFGEEIFQSDNISLDTFAKFIWNFGEKFLVEFNNQTYVWSSPDYNGDNTIRRYTDDFDNFTSSGFCVRDKGWHIIRDYCGPNVIFIND